MRNTYNYYLVVFILILSLHVAVVNINCWNFMCIDTKWELALTVIIGMTHTRTVSASGFSYSTLSV